MKFEFIDINVIIFIKLYATASNNVPIDTHKLITSTCVCTIGIVLNVLQRE